MQGHAACGRRLFYVACSDACSTLARLAAALEYFEPCSAISSTSLPSSTPRAPASSAGRLFLPPMAVFAFGLGSSPLSASLCVVGKIISLHCKVL